MPSHRALPFRAGPYECFHYLGGNLAEVYIARDLRTGFNRALKVIGSGYAPDSEFMQRFMAEGRAARMCTHPNIVTTYETDQADGVAYIAMEHLQGETLKLMLERGKPGSVAERINIAWQIAHGLTYLHSQGIIHRDIKPDNVHVDPSGHVKIFDFGVARMRRQQITREGQQLGTPLYMSPEQVRGEQVTFATDVYSYGVLLFVMFSGAFPYRAVSREDLYAAIVFYPPDMTSLDNKGIPPQIVNLIGQCLQKQAAARPATFREIESRLRPMAAPEVAGTGTSQFGALDVTAPVPVMVLKPKRRKSRGWLWAVLVVVAVSGGAAGYWYLNRPRVLEPRISAKGGFMVLVPAGPGFVGKERRAVDLPDFYIDRAEVSDEWYREFANSTGRADATPDAPASFPVVNVAYDDAAAFCAWAGKRLPTDVEWEKAARGPKGLAFPWGDQFRPDLANIPFEDQTRTLEPVESNLKGASHYGAINLVGNVWEWVAKQEELNTGDLRDLVLDPPATVGERAFQIRGGSFQNRIDLHRAVWDFAVAPARLKRSDVGFRCARLP